MTTKIYLPADSLSLYTQAADATFPTLTVANRCSIKTHPNNMIGVIDELNEVYIVEPSLFSDIQDLAGSPLGASFDATLAVLNVIVG